jgi:hypothetical protein
VTCADGQACSPRRAVLQPHLTRTGSTSVVNALTRLPVSATATGPAQGSVSPQLGGGVDLPERLTDLAQDRSTGIGSAERYRALV